MNHNFEHWWKQELSRKGSATSAMVEVLRTPVAIDTFKEIAERAWNASRDALAQENKLDTL